MYLFSFQFYCICMCIFILICSYGLVCFTFHCVMRFRIQLNLKRGPVMVYVFYCMCICENMDICPRVCVHIYMCVCVCGCVYLCIFFIHVNMYVYVILKSVFTTSLKKFLVFHFK